MINILKIKNFQSLASVTLRLGDVTMLVGPSNVGKTAVIRAIKALVQNAKGTDMVRHGTQEATVTAEIDDGTIISWIKNKRSKYTVNQQTYDKIGLDVPDIVQDKLRMGLHTVGSAEVDFNIDSQLTGPFFLGQSGPNRSKIIGTITHYDAIQLAVSEAIRDRKQYQTELKEIERQLLTVDQTIYGMRPIRDIEERLPDLQRASDALEQLRIDTADATRLSVELKDAQEAHLSVENGIAHADQIKHTIEQFDRVALVRTELQGEKREYQQAAAFLAEYQQAHAEYERCYDLLQTTHTQLIEAEQQLTLLAPLSETCPVCGQVITS